MKFKREFMQRLAYDDIYPKEAEVIENKIISVGRWDIHYEIVFKTNSKYYRSYYSIGATENQDNQPYEYDGNEIECEEVVPYEETVVRFKKVKE